MPLGVQFNLSKFLEAGVFFRVGGTMPIRSDVRIIASTNRDLDEAVREGRFSKNLYHRLNVITITVPPLREKKRDISELARYFMGIFSDPKNPFEQISKKAEEHLVRYDWPGNVVGLANVIKRAVLLGRGPEITISELPPNWFRRKARPPQRRVSSTPSRRRRRS